MKYKTLGTTGLVVSRMAFGAMTFTQGNQNIAAIYKVGEKLAAELVGRALDAGVNLFDTADGYAGGESEIPKGVASFSRMELLTAYTFSVSIDSSAEEVGATRNPVRIDGRAPLWEVLPLEWVVGLARPGALSPKGSFPARPRIRSLGHNRSLTIERAPGAPALGIKSPLQVRPV